MSIKREVYQIVEFLKDTLERSGTNGFALGMSGGIDSAVCAALAKRAIDELHNTADRRFPGKNYKLNLIILPMGNHQSDADVAAEVCASIGMDAETVHLGNALLEFVNAHGIIPDDEKDMRSAKIAKDIGNVKARLRMTAIYFAANMHNLLVLGTDNLAETYTGYFTKHGDGAADVFPLSAFTKREVYELGRFLELPESVLHRDPSAGLWDGQTDEQEMGIPYEFIDNRLEGMEALNRSLYLDKYMDYNDKLNRLHFSTEHKRASPHIFYRSEVE